MVTALKVAVELQAINGLDEDNVVNNWSIIAATGWDPAADLLEISGPLDNFYDGFSGTLSNSLARGAASIEMKFYDVTAHLDGSPHGSPVATDLGSLTGAAASPTDMPSEVAFVVTLRGDGAAEAAVSAPDGPDGGTALDRPKQRRTGRLYFGPWTIVDLTTLGRPSATLRTGMRNSMATLQTALAANGHSVAVWSRKNASFYELVSVETDDAWDTQRRRGVAPTSRESLAV